jgi:hypothetical protein
MEVINWQTQKVYGRDEVLRDIENYANEYSERVVQDVRTVMHDYEVDMYRLVLGIGKHYGMEKAYEIMSDTVVEKRLKWLDQNIPGLVFSGTDIERGLNLYLKYFNPKDSDFKIVEQTSEKVVFKRKDFVDAIFHACNILDLNVIEVNNKVYARAMNIMFGRVNLPVRYMFIQHQDGWYKEVIENIY